MTKKLKGEKMVENIRPGDHKNIDEYAEELKEEGYNVEYENISDTPSGFIAVMHVNGIKHAIFESLMGPHMVKNVVTPLKNIPETEGKMNEDDLIEGMKNILDRYEKENKDKVHSVNMLYLHQFPHDGDEVKCTGCNWQTSVTYWLAKNEEKAKEEMEAENTEGRCAHCITELIADQGLPITSINRRP